MASPLQSGNQAAFYKYKNTSYFRIIRALCGDVKQNLQQNLQQNLSRCRFSA
jgi:hypothetical protein